MTTSSNKIAIIGMACRFPKADTLDQYWQNLINKKNCLTNFSELPDKNADVFKKEDAAYIPVKGVINQPEYFDNEFFQINPNDALLMDPQQRILLECAWHSLEDAGYPPEKNNHLVYGVFTGMADSTYLQENILKNNAASREYSNIQRRIATSNSMLSTQISYRLNLKGPSININTACSTGLVTIIEACESLKNNHCDIALAGAIAISFPNRQGYFYMKDGIESADGTCRPFDSEANGTVFSDGAGIIVLKRFEQAVKDNDNIYAVIVGSGLNNDGADKLGFTAPSIAGQVDCLSNAIKIANIDPVEIGYIETHGTATKLGDLIEFSALKKAFEHKTKQKNFCLLGSVKGNIGHTDIAAGMAGLIKTALSLYKKQIPATANFNKANPQLKIENSPFYFSNENISWPTHEKAKYVGVSAFGVGGTNAHIILEAYEKQELKVAKRETNLFILSTKSKYAQKNQIENIITNINSTIFDSAVIQKKAYTLQIGREEFDWRSFIVINQHHKNNFINKNAIELKKIPHKNQEKIIFMFPGQGAQYPKACFSLYKRFPFFYETINEVKLIVKDYVSFDLSEVLFSETIEETFFYHTINAHLILFCIEYALAKLWISIGIKPAALIGHSFGEYVAACVAGVFSLKDAIYIIYHRGLLLDKINSGAMLAVISSDENIKKYLKYYDVELASKNTDCYFVISGLCEPVLKLQQELVSNNISCKLLKTDKPFHSRYVEQIVTQFEKQLNTIKFNKPNIPIISTLSGNQINSDLLMNKDYWLQQLRSPVQFYSAIDFAIKENYTIFLEVGPGIQLSEFVRENHVNSDITILNSLAHPKFLTEEETIFLTAVGRLWQLGININWSSFNMNNHVGRTNTIHYPFIKKTFLIKPDSKLELSNNKHHPDDWLYVPSFIRDSRINYSEDFSTIEQTSWILIKTDTIISSNLINLLEKLKANLFVFTVNQNNLSENKLKNNCLEFFSKISQQLKPNCIIIHDISEKKPSTKVNDYEDFFIALHIVQSYLANKINQKSLRYLALVKNTFKVIGNENTNPANTILTGLARVISTEHKEIKFHILDVDDADYSAIFRLKFILNYASSEKFLSEKPIDCVRGDYIWAPVFLQTKIEEKIDRFVDDGIYVFTGGLGGIALTLCETIAKTVKKPTLVLFNRSHFPEKAHWQELLSNSSDETLKQKINQLISIEKLGAIIKLISVDITHEHSLKNIVAKLIQEYIVINGLIHTAGIPGGGLVQLKEYEVACKVFDPKIKGTLLLAEAFAKIRLDFVVLCSSIIALVGEPGQIDYCSANAYLDAIANTSVFNTKHIVSINWNSWREVGMAVNTQRPEDVQFLNRENDISPIQAQYLWLKIMASSFHQVAISTCDIQIFSKGIHHTANASNNKDTDISTIDEEQNDNDFLPTNEMEQELLKIWESNLGSNKISVEDDYFKIGGHSLRALRLMDQINKRFASQLQLTDLYEARTIRKIAKIISVNISYEKKFIVLLKKGNTDAQPFFVCHPVSGLIFCFQTMANHWDLPNPLYAIQAPSDVSSGLQYMTIHEMAVVYLKYIKHIQPSGPYYLLGYSFGAAIVHEIIALLEKEGEEIGCYVNIDGWCEFAPEQKNSDLFFSTMHFNYPELSEAMLHSSWQRMEMLMQHQPSKINQPMVLFKAKQLENYLLKIDNPYNGWQNYTTSAITTFAINATHETIISWPAAQKIINHIKEAILVLADE